MIQERLKRLREQMLQNKVDIYYIPTSDDHDTEYVDGFYQARKYMSGFTGSAGVMVVTMTDAGLWTDGRYHIQAAHQLSGSPITLYRLGVDGVMTVEEYLEQHLPEGGCLGVNGQVISTAFGRKLENICKKKNATFLVQKDLVGEIWEDRPARSHQPIWRFENAYAGEESCSKIQRLRDEMKKENATVHLLAELDHIAWLYNIRGGDIVHFPVALAFAMVTLTQAKLFIQKDTVPLDVMRSLRADGVELYDYDAIYREVSLLTAADTVWFDAGRVNYALTACIPTATTKIERFSPVLLWQATKNETERNNSKEAHKKDAVAMIRFIKYIKEKIGKETMTELSVSDYLEKLRKEQKDFLDLSFETIAAYGPNAAMMHYGATLDSDAVLEAKGFLLVDSGAHYLQGSTDITRTIALGPLTKEERQMYTRTLQGHFQLANIKFHEGCSGYQLDILARGPLWECGIDYLCGTGHGVGNVLSVHEAPNGFRWRIVPERNDSAPLAVGMITTNEPGVYCEGKYGIRLENEMLCVEHMTSEYGRFLGFEIITYVPFDRDAIDLTLLQPIDIARIDAYHAMVYETMAPYLQEEERIWLAKETRPLA